MTDEILKWLVPFFCGSSVSALGTIWIYFKYIKDGVQCLLRAEILRQYEKWEERGYCPIYAKQALSREYRAYHKLGGNDVATEKYHEILKLPDEPEDDELNMDA